LAIKVFDEIEDGGAIMGRQWSFFKHEQRDIFGIDQIGFGATQLAFSKFLSLKGINDGDEKIGRLILEEVVEVFPILTSGFQADVKAGGVVGLAETVEYGEQVLIAGSVFWNHNRFVHELLELINNDDVMLEFADIDTDEEYGRHGGALLCVSDERILSDYYPLNS
jgi:hypothetical protein